MRRTETLRVSQTEPDCPVASHRQARDAPPVGGRQVRGEDPRKLHRQGGFVGKAVQRVDIKAATAVRHRHDEGQTVAVALDAGATHPDRVVVAQTVQQEHDGVRPRKLGVWKDQVDAGVLLQRLGEVPEFSEGHGGSLPTPLEWVPTSRLACRQFEPRMRAFWKTTTPSATEDPARLARLALPALALALEALEGAAKLTVSPGSPDAAEFRSRILSYGSELAGREPNPGRLEKIREAVGLELEAFAELQRTQVEGLVGEVRDSLRGILATLRSALDPMDGLADRMERMQRHLAFASECDDLRELRRVVREQAAAAKEALLRFAEDRQAVQEQLDSSVGVLEEKLEGVELASQIDHLTHLANRAALDYYLEAILQKARLGPTLYSLAVLDVDDLGLVNRQYGDTAGDQALNAIAGRLKAFLGSRGFLCRVGGDEFVVIGPWAPQGLKRRLDDLTRHLQKSRTLVEVGQSRVALTLSMSAGITLLTPDDSREDAMARAQAALAESKRGGKGKSEIHLPRAA